MIGRLASVLAALAELDAAKSAEPPDLRSSRSFGAWLTRGRRERTRSTCSEMAALIRSISDIVRHGAKHAGIMTSILHPWPTMERNISDIDADQMAALPQSADAIEAAKKASILALTKPEIGRSEEVSMAEAVFREENQVMSAYSFKRRFVNPIRVGLCLDPIFQIGKHEVSEMEAPIRPKRQTIRAEGKRRHARPGEIVQLYHGDANQVSA